MVFLVLRSPVRSLALLPAIVRLPHRTFVFFGEFPAKVADAQSGVRFGAMTIGGSALPVYAAKVENVFSFLHVVFVVVFADVVVLIVVFIAVFVINFFLPLRNFHEPLAQPDVEFVMPIFPIVVSAYVAAVKRLGNWCLAFSAKIKAMRAGHEIRLHRSLLTVFPATITQFFSIV